jgi:3-dehydroquinate dehydratase type I
MPIIPDEFTADPDSMPGRGVKGFNAKTGPKICVSLSEPSGTAMLEALKDSTPYADLAEIRLDALSDQQDLTINALIDKSHLPLIFTNRPVWEGGKFTGSEDDRIRPLLYAARSGASFIDIELKTISDIRSLVVKEARVHGAVVIVSFHDFSGTPDVDFLSSVLREAYDAGADIAKIVTMARSEDDARRVLSLYFRRQDTDLPLIAFAMGPSGRPSRLVCLFLGSCLTFASPLNGAETAPGQIPVKELRRMLDYLRHI